MRTRAAGLADRRGTSLAEMLLVLVLGGIITSAAVSLIGPTNQLARQATESAEVEEGARSTLTLLASTLRRVPQAGVLVATRDSVVVALPVGMGTFCYGDGSRIVAYLGLGGRPLSAASLDGFAIRDTTGSWTFTAYAGTSMFSGSYPGRSYCVAAGGGLAGTDADYVAFPIGGSVTGTGIGVLIWDRQTFRFGPSVLDPTTRGFFYGATGTPLLEVAFELHPNTRFEYRLRGQTTWLTSVATSYVPQIDAVRVIAGGVYDAAGTLVSREIPLMNSE